MSYTSENRGRPSDRWCRGGRWSREHRPAEMVSKVESRSRCAQVTALSGSLSHSQPGKNTHVEGSSGTKPSTSRYLQTRTARSFEPTRSRHFGGTRMHKSRETGTGSPRLQHCQAQFIPQAEGTPTDPNPTLSRPGLLSDCRSRFVAERARGEARFETERGVSL